MRFLARFKVWGVIALLSSLLATASHANWTDSAGGPGGEIPTPFEAANQRVELADSEAYILVGRVLFLEDHARDNVYVPFFEVDLKEHPWLANEKRRKSPLYRLEGGVTYWKQFRGLRIKLPCIGHAIIATGPSGKLEYMMNLRRVLNRPIEEMTY